MTENGEQSTTKFRQLLAKFLNEDHQVIDDTCLEKLLTHLSTEDNGKLLLQLQESRTFCERCLHAFEKGVTNESLLAFALRLHGLIIAKEAFFTSAELTEATRQITISPRLCMTKNASIQCAFVQMVSALLNHKSGVEWLASSDVWMTVQSLYEKNFSIYVSRECQKFLSNFVTKLGSEKENIQNKIYKNPLHALENDTNNINNLSLALDLLTHILEIALKTNNHEIPKNLEVTLSKACDNLLKSIEDTPTLTRVAKMQVLLRFALTQDSRTDIALLEEKIMELIASLLDSKYITIVQTLTLQCQNYWCILKPNLKQLEGSYQLDHQLVYIQVAPLLQMKISEIKKENARHFLENLCKNARAPTQLQGCRLKKVVVASSDPQLLACKTIHSLLQMKDYMSRDTAIFVFRTLMCILVQFIDGDSEVIIEAQNTGFMGTTLEAIIILIDNFHFTWRESVETTCLATFMQELLCEPALGQRQISQVLSVMRRAIENFMPPNLALLMNTLDDTPLQNLGPQLYRSLHNMSWEVRDSALEVLSTIAHISEDKFPAFQDHLLQHKLCSLAVSMAVGDEESYVRVSALNCLAAMVAVPCYWEKCLNQERLPEHLTNILCQESEGIVRREAASLANSLLYYKRFSPDEQERMYMVMASVASTDFHWEVKINALLFWKSSIDQQMSAQDMIDGKFPSVTFSGAARKIVTLDTAAIHTRLHRFLSELAHTRCLAVLLTALHDPDLQVARKSADILTNLQNLFQEYGLVSGKFSPVSSSVKETVMRNTPSPDEENGEVTPASSDQVIDTIVGQSDLALLASVCRAQLNLEDEDGIATNTTSTPHGVDVVKPGEFLQAMSGVDLNQIIASRESWMLHCSEHLDSLLTDMLEAREFEHKVNDMDCY